MNAPASPAIGKTARNERLKLRAASANAVGLAFGAVGFIAYVLHNYAVQVLADLED